MATEWVTKRIEIVMDVSVAHDETAEAWARAMLEDAGWRSDELGEVLVGVRCGDVVVRRSGDHPVMV